MNKAQRKAVARYRGRLKRQGMSRVELHVRKEDAELVRDIARALGDPRREQETRALLKEHFSTGGATNLKALLAAAPLEGVDLSREQDFGRPVDL